MLRSIAKSKTLRQHGASVIMVPVGSGCTVRGIIARPELNGRRGVVVTAPDDRGRVGVQLEGEAKPLSLKSSRHVILGAVHVFGWWAFALACRAIP